MLRAKLKQKQLARNYQPNKRKLSTPFLMLPTRDWQAQFFQQQSVNIWRESIMPYSNCGRLAYHFLIASSELIVGYRLLSQLKSTCVLSDVVPHTVNHWQQHPHPQTWLNNGHLNLSLFSPENEQCINLRQQEFNIKANNLINF